MTEMYLCMKTNICGSFRIIPNSADRIVMVTVVIKDMHLSSPSGVFLRRVLGMNYPCWGIKLMNDYADVVHFRKCYNLDEKNKELMKYHNAQPNTTAGLYKYVPHHFRRNNQVEKAVEL